MRSPGPPAPRKSCGGKRKSAPPVRHSNANGVDDAPVSMRSLSHRSALTICDSVSVFRRFEGQSRCSAVALDGTAWTGETDGTIVIRLVPSGMEVRRIASIGRAAVLVMENVSGNMWAGYSDGAIRVFDYVTQKVLRQSTQHTAAVYAMCAAGGYVFTGGADGKVYQWMTEDLHYSHMYYGHRNAVRSLTTYTDPKSGCRCLVSGSDDGTVKVWEATVANTNGAPRKDGGCVYTLDGQGRCVLSILVLEDTAELWAGSEDSAIRVWDLSSMTVTTVITGHRAPVATLQQVGDTVWSGSKDGAITITNRFSKDIVHQASQPPVSSSASAGGQRWSVSILPVTRSVVYEVWATAVDGSWQCWNFTVPKGVKSYVKEAEVLKGGGCPSHTRPQRLSRVSQRCSHNVRSGSVNAYSKNGSRSASAPAHSSDDKLRESVAQTRHTVALLLAGSKVHQGNGFAHRSEAVNVGIVDDDDIPLDDVAESIRNDHTAETQKELQLKQAALAKEREKSAELRAELEKMCKDPVAIAEEGAANTFRRTDSLVIGDVQAKTNAMERQSGTLGSPTTEKLVGVSSQLELMIAQNKAMAAALTESTKVPA